MFIYKIIFLRLFSIKSRNRVIFANKVVGIIDLDVSIKRVANFAEPSGPAWPSTGDRSADHAGFSEDRQHLLVFLVALQTFFILGLCGQESFSLALCCHWFWYFWYRITHYTCQSKHLKKKKNIIFINKLFLFQPQKLCLNAFPIKIVLIFNSKQKTFFLIWIFRI